jgi:photosystem II stability/assembly factor-like uncharacterized protein
MRGKVSVARRALAVSAVMAALALTSARATVDAQQPAEAAAIKSLYWREIGPANPGGRISAIVGIPGDPKVFYVGAAAGGIFKTTNAGTTVEPIFDDQNVQSIGDIAIAPSDPNVLWVGSGEGNPRNSAGMGDGVYRSTDAGRTWVNLGLGDTEKIARVRVHPKDPDTAWVCALGHEWGPNEERGVFKTTDAGKTWKKVLYLDNLTGCSDLDINLSNPRILFAGMYTFRRWAWFFESGGKQTAVYRSMDGGETWQKLANGLPKGPMDRIGLSIAQSSPNILYVISETTNEGELWRSDDNGESWRMVNDDRNINFRPFYYSDIRVDPNNPDIIYSLSGPLSKSADGGRTFARIANSVHGDHQAMWIDPQDSDRVLNGSDGGFQVSYDAGRTWDVMNTFAATQFYHLDYDLRDPYYVCGGLQDNGTWCGPSRTGSPMGVTKADWYTVGGGDGFFGVPMMKEPHMVFATAQGGYITVRDIRSGRSWNIQPYPNRVGSVGDAMKDHKYRFNWNPPVVRSPHDPKVIYFGGNVLFKTTSYGQSWDVISPDLTTDDKSKQQSSGGEIVTDNTAAEFHCTIIAIAPSPVDPNVIWVGTDDGNVQVTRDGGKTWNNVFKNPPGLAPNAFIPTVDASHFDAGTAYAAADHHQDNDYQPYAYKTTDFGKTWTAIHANLPKRGWIHAVREDPKNRNLLYAGTELGVYASWDGGGRWVSIRNNLPAVPVRDMFVHTRDNDLVLATHGRGAWILDDVTPLQKLGEAMAASAPMLFDPPQATRWVMWNRESNVGEKWYRADNPANGALLTYHLKSDAKDVTIAIADKSGKTVRTIRNAARTSGVNRIVWDLRMDVPPPPAGSQPTGFGPSTGSGQAGRGAGAGAAAFFGFGGGGIAALPGEYTVKLRVDGRETSKPVAVRMDPRVDISMADLQAQYDLAMQLQDLSTKATAMTVRVDDLTRQLTALQQRLSQRRALTDGSGAAGQAESADLGGAVKAAIQKLKTLRDTKLARPLPGLGYRQYPRFQEEVRTVFGIVNGDPFPPTEGAKIRYKELVEEGAQLTAELNAIITTEVAFINQAMGKLPYVAVETIK